MIITLFTGTYDQLRSSGFLQLPCKSTLNLYTGFTDIRSSYNPDIIRKHATDLKVTELKSFEKCCGIMFDEMKVKSGLVFSRNTGQLVGFTELGQISEEISVLERSLEGALKEKPLATHMLCIMIRGYFKHFNLPIGLYPTNSVDAEQLFTIIWEAVHVVEAIGLHVHSFVSDGASANRKFYEMHRLEDSANVSPEGLVYWAWNRYDLTRKIYFFSDPPHLLKTLRNNLENSGGNKGTRNLMVCKSVSSVQSWYNI